MIESISDLLRVSGGDGCSASLGSDPAPDRDEADLLLSAWQEERGRSIESLLLLGRVRRLLVRISASGRLTPGDEGAVKRLLAAIDLFGRDGAAPDA